MPRAGSEPLTFGLIVQRAIHYTTKAVAMLRKIVLYISNPTPNPTPNPTLNPTPNPKTNPNVTNPNPNPTPN